MAHRYRRSYKMPHGFWTPRDYECINIAQFEISRPVNTVLLEYSPCYTSACRSVCLQQGRHGTRLVMTRLVMTRLSMTRLVMTRLCITRLFVTRLCITRLFVTRLSITRLSITRLFMTRLFITRILITTLIARTPPSPKLGPRGCSSRQLLLYL